MFRLSVCTNLAQRFTVTKVLVFIFRIYQCPTFFVVAFGGRGWGSLLSQVYGVTQGCRPKYLFRRLPSEVHLTKYTARNIPSKVSIPKNTFRNHPLKSIIPTVSPLEVCYRMGICTLPIFVRIQRPRWRPVKLNDRNLRSKGKIHRENLNTRQPRSQGLSVSHARKFCASQSFPHDIYHTQSGIPVSFG